MERVEPWRADYLTHGKDPRPFTVVGISSKECPVSAITGQSQELLEIFARSKRMKEAAGMSLYGPNMADWPARMVDVFDVFEAENINYENAKYDATYD